MDYIAPHVYHAEAAKERERRLAWFKDARFGMFIHYGVLSQFKTGEWRQ